MWRRSNGLNLHCWLNRLVRYWDMKTRDNELDKDVGKYCTRFGSGFLSVSLLDVSNRSCLRYRSRAKAAADR